MRRARRARRGASSRIAVGLLAARALLHGARLLRSCTASEPTPQLTDLPRAVSLAAWLGTLFFLALALPRCASRGLVVLVAPAAFLGVFVGVLGGRPRAHGEAGSALWPHAHVLLASGGLALLGVAGARGPALPVAAPRLKRKRPSGRRSALPSLEALDRVERARASASASCCSRSACVTGVLWVETREGRLWPGGPHANAALVAWAHLRACSSRRASAARQGARGAALGASPASRSCVVAVVGVECSREACCSSA